MALRTYQQDLAQRARMQTLDRTEPAKVLWLMFEGGIERHIYEQVMDKKDFTLQHYRAL